MGCWAWVGNGGSSLRAMPTAHTTWLCPQPPSTPRMYAGPRSSAVSPQARASRPASTVTTRVTVPTAATSLAAVSRELGGELWALGPSPPSLLRPGSSEPLPRPHPAPPPFAPPTPHFCSHLPVPPQVVTPPQESVQASRGQTVTLTCVAIGVPTPIINWRLNWGHIPSHPRYSSGPRQELGTWWRCGQWSRPDPHLCLGAYQGDNDE